MNTDVVFRRVRNNPGNPTSRNARPGRAIAWVNRAGFVLVFALIPACVSPNPAGNDNTDEGVSATIGTGGGDLEAEGVKLTVPEAALSEEVTITVSEASDGEAESYETYSPVYEFEPSGLTFDEPVKIRIELTGEAEHAVVFWSRPEGDGFEALPSTVVGDFVEAEVTHFSSGFLAHPLIGFWDFGSSESRPPDMPLLTA